MIYRVANQSCQPTPGPRLGIFLLPVARRGCTLRYAHAVAVL